VPRPDDVMGEVGVAFIVSDGTPPTLDGLREFGAAHMAAYKLPEDIRYVAELPLTSGDKVDRRALVGLIKQ
jgi:acyl-CoA synthetase (AMP-forming)/AMP-acid ligase II